jgi:hypothetical protein
MNHTGDNPMTTTELANIDTEYTHANINVGLCRAYKERCGLETVLEKLVPRLSFDLQAELVEFRQSPRTATECNEWVSTINVAIRAAAIALINQ